MLEECGLRDAPTHDLGIQLQQAVFSDPLRQPQITDPLDLDRAIQPAGYLAELEIEIPAAAGQPSCGPNPGQLSSLITFRVMRAAM